MIAYFICALLFAAAISDLRTREIPPLISLLIITIACFACYEDLPKALIGAVCSALILYLPSLIFDGAFGGGDIKLIAAVGFYLDFSSTLLGLILALFISLLWALGYKAIRHQRIISLPLAPFIFIVFTPFILLR